jgi:hypothetical protein
MFPMLIRLNFSTSNGNVLVTGKHAEVAVMQETMPAGKRPPLCPKLKCSSAKVSAMRDDPQPLVRPSDLQHPQEAEPGHLSASQIDLEVRFFGRLI